MCLLVPTKPIIRWLFLLFHVMFGFGFVPVISPEGSEQI